MSCRTCDIQMAADRASLHRLSMRPVIALNRNRAGVVVGIRGASIR